jgi:hypothetical protein
MSFWRRLFAGGSRAELATVKTLIKKSSGARGFLDRAVAAGFTVEDEGTLGLTLVGQNCRFTLVCLASRGNDKIWSLVFKAKSKPCVNLVSEGRITF